MHTLTAPRHIIITGASSGIGAALAVHYAQRDVVLGLIGRDAARLEQVAQACADKGAAVHMGTIDVRDADILTDWLLAFDAQHPVDLLIANAGIGGNGAKTPDAASLAAATDMFHINMDGVVNTIHPLIPPMAARGQGQMALMASLAGYRGLAGAPAYSASKGFVKLYGEGLRGSLAPHGIAISVICPGFVESGITAKNNFPMPFLMAGPKAAQIIAHGLSRNRARIAFPWPMALAVWALSCLPACVADRLVRLLPTKN